MKQKMKRSLYFTKTFLFSLLLYLSVIYTPLLNYAYEGKLSRGDIEAIAIGTFSFFGISNGRLRVNKDILKSAETGEAVGLLTTRVVPTKVKDTIASEQKKEV